MHRFFRPAVCLAVLSTLAAASRGGELLPADSSIQQAIDHYVDARLAAVGVAAATQADDSQLVRRTTLDLVGRIPAAAEARAFVASDNPAKREQLVDRLLASPSFVRHQADQFDALLMQGVKDNIRDYLQTAFRENRPWDRMFRELIVGEPEDASQKGAIQFVRSRASDVDKLTNEVSVLFFGVNVSCAKCHDHPLVPDWTQEHFYGMKSFFNRTFDNGGLLGELDYGLVAYKTKKDESRTARLMFLTGEVVAEPESAEPSDMEKKAEKQRLEELKKNKQPPPAPKFSRRAQLIDVALKSKEPSAFFSRAIVNHVWNRFFGRGLVSPVDQMHSGNPPSHPELLDWLARDFARNGYDLRRLTRGIVLSRAYSRSSDWDSADKPQLDLYAVALPRPLSPQQYGATLRLAGVHPDQFAADLSPEQLEQRASDVAAGGRGLAGHFEQPGEDFQVGVDEALLLSNNEQLAGQLLRDGKDSLLEKLKSASDRRAALIDVSWNIFSRPPSDDELTLLEKHLAPRGDRLDVACRQVIWAMLTSSECRFNY